MTIIDLPMLVLAWLCLVKPPVPFISDAVAKTETAAYRWWWSDHLRANYLMQAASIAGLTKQGEVPPWFGLDPGMDTPEYLQGYVYTIKMRWYGRPVEGDR